MSEKREREVSRVEVPLPACLSFAGRVYTSQLGFAQPFPFSFSFAL